VESELIFLINPSYFGRQRFWGICDHSGEKCVHLWKGS